MARAQRDAKRAALIRIRNFLLATDGKIENIPDDAFTYLAVAMNTGKSQLKERLNELMKETPSEEDEEA